LNAISNEPHTSPASCKPFVFHSFFKDPGLYEESGLGEHWTCLGGQWSVQAGIALQSAPFPGKLSEARLDIPYSSLILDLKMRTLEAERRAPGAYGFLLDGEQGELFGLEFLPRSGETGTATGLVSTGFSEGRREKPLDLPWEFQADQMHGVRLEVSNLQASLSIDGRLCWQGSLEDTPTRLVLFTRGSSAAFAGLELRPG
jgi:hypothetical protein